MARKKKKAVDEPKVEKKEEQAAKPVLPATEEVKPKVVKKKEDDVDIFIREQLKVINNMTDTAKARRLAARVLRNKRKG